MPRFELRQSTRHITSYAGLILVGQCLEAARLELLDKQFPAPEGQMPTSDIVKSYVGLLALGKGDFDAIEPFRNDRFFREALGIGKVPSSAWMRQRMERMAAAMREETDAYSVRLLRNAEAPVTALNGFACLDFDTFVMDNGGTKKECVGRTYQGVDGYTPVAAYLGNEGWCLALELRPGSQHSALETHFFLERVLPRAHELATTALPVLSRSDSGFDLGSELLFQQDDEKRSRGKEKRDFRLVVRLIERTIDPKGQVLLFPEYRLEGWWASLDAKPEKVIELYREHATHEQFHSEIKSDLDLERLPSGQVRLQRPRAAPGDAGLQLPAPRRPDRPSGKSQPGAPPGQAPAHQDGAAGNHLPRRPIHPQGAAAGLGLRRALPGLQGIRPSPGAPAGSGAVAVSARFPAASPRFETDDRQRSGIALPKRRETRTHPRENRVMDAKMAVNRSLFFSFGPKWTRYRVFKIQHGRVNSQTRSFNTDSGGRKASSRTSRGCLWVRPTGSA